MQVYDSILDTIGNTPLVRVPKLNRGLKPTILAKIEYLNPGGSVKDRIGLRMIEDAEQRGLLQKGGTIVEPTSGNTGVGLAMAAALKGYKMIFVMADKQSADKISLLKAYGADVVITPTAVERDSPESYYSVAERLAREIPGAYQPNQYFNMVNPQVHYETTGPEIWQQTDGKIDVLVAGVGTGGTISGVGRFLKEQNPNVLIVGADPEGSIFTTGVSKPKTYKTEGIGEDFYPDTFDRDIVDEWVRVSDRDSFLTARRITREEGILVGGSCGTAMFAAMQVARRMDEGKLIVVILPDTGRNYLSKIYNDAWMRENGFLERYPLQARVFELLDAGHRELPPLISVCTSATVREVVDVMHKYGISQMPVVRMPDESEHQGDASHPPHAGQMGISPDDAVVGSVQEKSLLELIFRNPQVIEEPVETIMEPAFPEVTVNEEIQRILPLLLDGTSTVMVQDNGKPIGILTRTDVLEFVVHNTGGSWR